MSLDAVRIITAYVRTRNYHLPAAVLETFLSLRLLEELDPVAANSGEEDDRRRKRKGKEPHESRKNRKVRGGTLRIHNPEGGGQWTDRIGSNDRWR